MNLPVTKTNTELEIVSNVVESVLVQGDLSKLPAAQRVEYYNQVCKSLELNPLTRPFDYISLKGKLTLYAKKDCTDQIRRKLNVSTKILERQFLDGLYIVRVHATLPNGRTDESIAALNVANLKGEDLANAIMKCETKAKRRVTLSICGLGFIDETEIETIKDARIIPPGMAEDENLKLPEYEPENKEKPTKEELNFLVAESKKKNWEQAQVTHILHLAFGHPDAKGLNKPEYEKLLELVTTKTYDEALAAVAKENFRAAVL